MSGLGALTKLSKFLRDFTDETTSAEMRKRISDIAYNIEQGFEPEGVARQADRRFLLDYLRDEGARPEWRSMAPGDTPRKGALLALDTPGNNTRLFRGADVHYGPKENLVFTTTDPKGAAWYAAEFPDNPNSVGAITEYALQGTAKPARIRDMYETLLSDPKLTDTVLNSSPTTNLWDWVYHPEFRQALVDRGFNSALGLDTVESDAIEAFIPLGREMLKPVNRMVTIPEWSAENLPLKRELPEFEGLRVLSPLKPYTKRKEGGLVQVKK